MTDPLPEGADHTRVSYDRVAAEYAARLNDELTHKPLERALLDAVATRGSGPVCDLGCGPGQVGGYLRARGARALGVDLSHGMARQARALHPDLPVAQADMRALPFAAGALAGVAAFYSLIHIPPPGLPAALRELRRVVAPGGWLIAGFHVGQEVRHFAEWWGATVDVDFYFFEVEPTVAACRAAGWIIEDVVERPPYPEVEVQTQRAYILARAPG
jgi:SAM-dependent methyltransferase